MKKLTEKQKQIVAVIKDLIRKKGESPTLEEIRVAMGYSSIFSVQRHIKALKEKGVITNTKNQSRSLEINLPDDQSLNIPLVGSIACGMPLLAIENIEAYIPYDRKNLSGNSKDYFFLQAVGDSMNQSKPPILDGDFVLIKKQSSAEIGQKVVALVGDEATIKRLDKKGSMLVLSPESDNPANKPIYLMENPMIQGVVIDVVRANKKGGYK